MGELHIQCPNPACDEHADLIETFRIAARGGNGFAHDFAMRILFDEWLGRRTPRSIARDATDAVRRLFADLAPGKRVEPVSAPSIEREAILAFADYARMRAYSGEILHWIPRGVGVAVLRRFTAAEGEPGVHDEETPEGRWVLWAPVIYPDTRRKTHREQLRALIPFHDFLGVGTTQLSLGTLAEHLYLAAALRRQMGRWPLASGDAVRTKSESARIGRVALAVGKDRLCMEIVDDQVGHADLGLCPIVTL